MVDNIVSQAFDSLEKKNGASHAEVKIAKDGTINIIEIGARMGGDCIGTHLVRYSTGYDYVKMVIDVACGKAPDFKMVCDTMKVESKFIFSEEDIEEYEIDKKEGRVLQTVDFHPENIGHITDSSNRAGCYIRRVE